MIRALTKQFIKKVDLLRLTSGRDRNTKKAIEQCIPIMAMHVPF